MCAYVCAMALELKTCIREECNGIQFTDKTRDYSIERTGGYGPENGVTGPSDFDSYTFSYWDASKDPAVDDPTFTFDLLSDVPAQSPDEDYDWPVFTFEQMGVSSTEQGIAYFEVVGVKDGDEYRNDFTALLIQDLVAEVASKMKGWRPGTKSQGNCIPVQRMAEAIDMVRCGWDCDEEQAKDNIKWIKANINSICC